MKTLYLPLKAHWYDMIEAGIKTEEYRELKPYWMKRICKHVKKGLCYNSAFCQGCRFVNAVTTDITEVCFSYGYTKRRMTFKVTKIRIGMGNQEWGAPHGKKVFIIMLGERTK